MRYRPAGHDPEDPRLGRFVPDDWEHYDRYPLSNAPRVPTTTPVVLGVNWYAELDQPIRDRDGLWWVAPHGPGTLTRIMGGHAVCLEPGGAPTSRSSHRFHDQKTDGSCVGWALSRAMTILNHRKYSAHWLWDRAKECDRWPETNPGDGEGTSIRAGAEVLRHLGHVPWQWRHHWHDHTHRAHYTPDLADGIHAYRWASSVDEIHAVLANPTADALEAVPILNSWGLQWPYRVWMPDDVLHRLLAEDGEAAIPTDRATEAVDDADELVLAGDAEGDRLERERQEHIRAERWDPWDLRGPDDRS